MFLYRSSKFAMETGIQVYDSDQQTGIAIENGDSRRAFILFLVVTFSIGFGILWLTSIYIYFFFASNCNDYWATSVFVRWYQRKEHLLQTHFICSVKYLISNIEKQQQCGWLLCKYIDMRHCLRFLYLNKYVNIFFYLFIYFDLVYGSI